ncbi:MAG: WD40 repeat domain-containing protein, partial [Planctomycetota bacterium]
DGFITREAAIEFLPTDTLNQITGLAGIENGFLLQSPTTTLTFDGFFPVSGDINFRGGSVYLSRDLKFDSVATMSYPGNFYGNGRTVYLSSSVTTFSIHPPGFYIAGEAFGEVDREALGAVVNGVDWSYDDFYVIAGDASNILHLYSFDGTALTAEDTDNTANVLYSARAHPSGYYFAVGRDAGAGDDVIVYGISGGLLVVDSGIGVAKDAMGVGWSADGSYLAASYDTDVAVFSFTPGTLSLVDPLDWGGDAAVSNSIAWDQTGGYLAVGTDDSLRILAFNGSILSSQKIETIGVNVLGVDWARTGSWIAIGNDGASNQLRVYEYDSSGDTLTLRKQISVGATVQSVHWNSDATRLAVGKDLDGGGTELQVYDFNQSTYDLTLRNEVEETTIVNDIRFSHDDRYVLVGESGQDIAVFDLGTESFTFTVEKLTFDNVNIYLSEDLNWHAPVEVSGSCVIDGGGSSISFENGGYLTVTTGASLFIKNARLYRESELTNISCYADDSSITFSGCTIGLRHPFEFSKGSLKFVHDVVFSGTNKFTYSSKMTSSIAMNSTLKFDLGATLSYDPPIADRGLFYMPNETAMIHLDSCTVHSTSTGLRLTKGTLILENDVTFSAEGSVPSESISLGDGTSQNDLTIKIMSEAEANCYGAFRYDNVT